MSKNSGKGWNGLFKKNLSLAKDVSVYLDAIKLFIIQDVTRININEVSNCEIPRQPIEVSEEQRQPLEGIIFNETIQNGYLRIRMTLIGDDQCIKEYLPSIYQITKNRPEVESFEVRPKSSHEARSCQNIYPDRNSVKNGLRNFIFENKNLNSYTTKLHISG